MDCSALEILTGETVTRSQAMEIPTVSACIAKIADTVSRLPVKLYQKNDGKITEITDDSRLLLLNGETGDTLTTVDMWKAVIEDYFLGNGAWIYINSDGITPQSLHYVDSRNISIMTNNEPIFRAFDIFVNGRKFYDFQFVRLFRKTKTGYSNIPLQSDNPTIFSACYNALKLENSMNGNGGNKRGFLKAKTKLSAEALDTVRNSFPSVYGNGNGKIPVLNDGLDFEPLSSTAVELQINENKKENSTEICKLFGFPHTVIDGGASDNDNKKFTETIVSILNQIETALDAFLLLETEKNQGFYFVFDTKELTRGSLRERYEAYQIAIKNHILQIDEIRHEEDYEPLGFNFMTMGLGDVLLNPKTMEIFTPNTGQTSKLGENRAEIELRYNHNHDEKGRFCSGGGGGRMSSSSSSRNSEKSLDNSGKSDIMELGKNYGKKRKQIDVPYDFEVDESDLPEFNHNALKSIIEETGYSEEEAKKFHDALIEWFGGDYEEFTAGNRKEQEKIINNGLARMGAYDGTIGRGMVFSDKSEYDKIACLKIGEIVPGKSVYAWSSEMDIAKNYSAIEYKNKDSVLLVCNDNKTGVGMQHISKYGKTEAEILAPSTTKYEIIDKQVINKYDYLVQSENSSDMSAQEKRKRLDKLFRKKDEINKYSITIFKVKEV